MLSFILNELKKLADEKKSKILLLRKGRKRVIEKLPESFLNFEKPRLKKIY